ncbi:EexN family lipoprotein [Pseudomonas sp. FP818]|uniref:EexN family lipoprotein n=1 Tax=Pseudomonas sp. FP818 TaxID=2954099 RepID=UPI0027355BCE|nr:EexN family lipoprotein [Pseudomonas sp. FP818]WLI34274.1 EexN family lipoprotein [Pseudomonas sp. FP818]
MKSLLTTTALLMIVTAMLSGCGKQESVQTVDWYKANSPERLKVLERCRANPGELALTPNCVNAKIAANALVLENREYKHREPMNFSSQGK